MNYIKNYFIRLKQQISELLSELHNYILDNWKQILLVLGIVGIFSLICYFAFTYLFFGKLCLSLIIGMLFTLTIVGLLFCDIRTETEDKYQELIYTFTFLVYIVCVTLIFKIIS